LRATVDRRYDDEDRSHIARRIGLVAVACLERAFARHAVCAGTLR